MARASVVALVCASCAVSGAEDPPGEGGKGSAFARKRNVGCAHSHFASIQAAIDASTDGDVVVVCAGTYAERLTISGKDLVVRARSGASPVIDAGGLGPAITVEAGAVVKVFDLTLRNGASTKTGGNLTCSDSHIHVRNTRFEDGTARRGGGFGTTDCTGFVTDSTFVGNHADEKGGGLYMSEGMSLVGNTFDGNDAAEGGGAYVQDSTGAFTDNVFVRNTAIDDGGGLFLHATAGLVQGNTFEENVSDEEGGGLRVRSGAPIITENTFVGNTASWRGGGVKISHDEVVMSDNTFVENRSYGWAGALLLLESASVLTGETFIGNEADKGGAIAVLEGWGSVTIEDSRFEDNEAEDAGGHVYVDLLGYSTRFRRVDLVGGTAPLGGAVYATSASALETLSLDHTRIVLENTLVDGNVATMAGGAVYADAAVGEILNSVLAANAAPVGAGIHVVNGVVGLDIRNTVLTDQRTGAAISVASGFLPTVAYDAFNANDLDVSGMGSPIGFFGNLAADPGFLDRPGGDFHLTPGSALVDAGDPTIDDRDGSRSDIGLHGGPLAPD